MNKKTTLLSLALSLLLAFSAPDITLGQQQTADTNTSKNTNGKAMMLSLQAERMDAGNQIKLDGKLDDAIWQQASVATGFTQRVPHDGQPASEETEARIVYTDDAIYVGIRAYDSAMDSVAATLFRKDGGSYSDWIYVSFDSYNDDRTSFSFAVNPKGVRKDILTFNNNREDLRWDAVWEANTALHDDSWTVEMRIPLSQLRFSAKNDPQQWGINFQRRIARYEEISFWSPTPQDASGFVSQFGQLEGISGLKEPARLEVSPYASSSLTKAPGSAENPFYSPNDATFSAGADVKYDLSSNFTLTGTVNPDFGQVEADPAVINLSAFETFFPEQRPFFQEGSDIFEFGRTQSFISHGTPNLFYSRRIGRQPTGRVQQAGINAQFADSPDQTTIAGAAKVSGKTENGFSLGVLNAFTTREKADYVTFANDRGTLSVEPPTNYFVGRAKQDLSNGRTVIGGYASAVNRAIDTPYLREGLHKSAYIGGVDFEHSWKDREYILSGVLSGSSVSGSSEALLRTQNSSARYYNRPDADYLSVDPNKTSLNGYFGELSFAKMGGRHWRGSASYSVVSPGYEVNDIGFQHRADQHVLNLYLNYQENNAPKPLRSYSLRAYTLQGWNFGGDRTANVYGFSSSIQFTNLWGLNFNAGLNGNSLNDRLLRGGPLAASPQSNYLSAVLSSNRSKMVSFYMGHLRGGDEAGEVNRDVFLNLTLRPAPNVQLSLRPNYNWGTNPGQYVTRVQDPLAGDTYGARYVFAEVDRQTISTSLRLDWTFTPNMSLQTYVRPYITTADFYNYKEFTTPRQYRFEVYGTDRGTIGEANGMYTVDPDGAGPASSFGFPDRDFNFRSIQTNAVFRWEYAPGSTLFLVWQQDRRSVDRLSGFRPHRDVSGLFDAEPTNVFLIKMSYWFGT